MYHIYLTKEGVDGEYVPERNVNLQVTITYTTVPAGWSKVNWVGHYKRNGTTVSGAEISDGSASGTGVKQIKVSGNSITFHIQSFSVFPVAALAAEGLRNKEIAQRLFISEETVKSHIRSIFNKTNIDRRSKLVDLLK